MADRITNDPIVINLFKILERGNYEGTVGELYQRLSEMREDQRDKSFPATPAYFSRLLDRLKPALLKAGIVVEFGPRTRRGKSLFVSLNEEAEPLLEKADVPESVHEY